MDGNVFLTAPDGKTVRIIVADTFFKRFAGLMGRKISDYGLMLSPCNAIHTCFMRYDLDVFFLDRDNRVIEVVRGIKPWRTTRVVKNARSVLELPTALPVALLIKEGMKVDLQT